MAALLCQEGEDVSVADSAGGLLGFGPAQEQSKKEGAKIFGSVSARGSSSGDVWPGMATAKPTAAAR